MAQTETTNKYSFPYHYATYKHGIRPNHVTEDEMNESLYKLYEEWRSVYLWKDGCPEEGMLRVWGGNGHYKNGTCSEGVSYGMMISVYMATDDNHGHEDFDALYKYYKYYTQKEHGAVSEGLMGWLIDSTGKPVSGGAATDGDLDVAFALLLASKKWGKGAYDYLEEAKRLINIMMEEFVNQDNFGIKYGNVPNGTFTMSAYLMPAWFKEFYKVTGDERWLKVIDFSYKAIKKYYDLNPDTALMPYTFNIFTLEVRNPAKDYYSWDSCRVPWRIGTDYIWNGTEHSSLARDAILTNVKWFNKVTDGDPANNVITYSLAGEKLVDFASAAIVGPMGVGAMVDESQQEWLNKIYDYMVTTKFHSSDDAYFTDQLILLTLIVMTGNHPNMLEM